MRRPLICMAAAAAVSLWPLARPARAHHILPAIVPGSIAIGLQPIATGMGAPDYAVSPPGETNRMFVVEQNGLLRIIENGTLQPGAALDMQSRVAPPLNTGSFTDERGFLGLAFHPGFANP